MKEVKAIIQSHKLDQVLNALHQVGGLPSVVISGALVTDVAPAFYEGVQMSKIELMVADRLAETVAAAIQVAAHTGAVGDGRIYILPIEECILIRTGEKGEDAR